MNVRITIGKGIIIYGPGSLQLPSPQKTGDILVANSDAPGDASFKEISELGLAESGGSEKTLKDVEDEIVQLAGDVDNQIGAVDVRTEEVFKTIQGQFIVADGHGNVLSVINNDGEHISEFSEQTKNTINNTQNLFTSIYNGLLVTDENGYVVFNSNFKEDNFLNDDIVSRQYLITGINGKHKSFPTIEIGLTGTWHVLYKQGNTHADNTASIVYAYSLDKGRTFISNTVINSGSDGTSWKSHLDPRIIRMSNGKYLLLHAEVDWGVDGNVVGDYTTVAHIIDEVDGILDFENSTKINLPYPEIGRQHMPFGGAILERDGNIYALGYREYKIYLHKSSDFGSTWATEPLMKDGAQIEGTESAMVDVNGRIYIVIRHKDVSGADNNPARFSPIYYTDDNFGTLHGGWIINRTFSGGNATSLGDGAFGLIGRSGKGTELSFYKHNREQAQSLVLRQYVSPYWDADYAWMVRDKGYYIAVYYTVNGAEIAYKKIKSSGIINL